MCWMYSKNNHLFIRMWFNTILKINKYKKGGQIQGALVQ